MASCLGVYIEDKLIKYAKVSKNNEDLKVESFGVKFYDDFETAIKQIIDETYSYKIPISINATGEKYNNFEVFSLLSEKDIDGIIKTEFENICYEKDVNKNIYEQRYVFANTLSNSEKVKIIHVSLPKTNISERKNQFSQYKICNISPMAMTLPNIIKKDKKSSVIIVNIEDETTITKLINNVISDVKILPVGTKNILENINKKENSYSKSYEVCKNLTIYTESNSDLQYEESENLEYVMPTLFQIVNEVKKIVDESMEEISNIYITGSATVINNIDIYFQDYFKSAQCEILKPNFINNNSKINIKDYIEVNSAIALAVQGIEKNTINFLHDSKINKLLRTLNSDIKKPNIKASTKSIDGIFEKFGRQYNTIAITAFLLLVSYITGTFIISKHFDKKIEIADSSINKTNERITTVQGYNEKLNAQISEYQRLISNIENINDANSEDKRFRNSIPNLLNNIMTIIPKGVRLTSIQNTTNTHIVIKAVSEDYEQAAFFKAKLKTEKILKNVVSDTGVVQNEHLNITIEGELP